MLRPQLVQAIVLVVLTVLAVGLAGAHLYHSFLLPWRQRRATQRRFAPIPQSVQARRLRRAVQRRRIRAALRTFRWLFAQQGHYWLTSDGTPNARLRQRNAWQAAHA